MNFAPIVFFKDEKDGGKDLVSSIISLSVNRLFRIVFVWSVSLAVHYIFFNS